MSVIKKWLLSSKFDRLFICIYFFNIKCILPVLHIIIIVSLGIIYI